MTTTIPGQLEEEEKVVPQGSQEMHQVLLSSSNHGRGHDG